MKPTAIYKTNDETPFRSMPVAQDGAVQTRFTLATTVVVVARFQLVAVILLLAVNMAVAANLKPLALIPLPQKVVVHPGTFQLAGATRIQTDFASRKTADLLAKQLRRSTGYPLKVHWRQFSDAPGNSAIQLTTKDANTNLGAEGYELTVSSNSVVIRAPTQAGLFYGTRTLLQLLPPEILATNVVGNVGWQMPCVQIKDWPRFKWRGLMLDVSRHFYNKSKVEHILDFMAFYKLNRFHWHLVDNPGWRIEIKKYPRLTAMGAWRKQIWVDPPSKPGVNADPAWLKPDPDKFGKDGRYGGYYTPNDIREVVAYAAARHITVVPEIEMPGHSDAALQAYPQFNCLTAGGKRASDIGVYCAGNDQTYVFLENVLKEVFALFPGKYVHIGGDEVNTANWKYCPLCQARMKEEGFANTEQLQSYFTKRIEKFVLAHGKTLIGWSEILKGGLASNVVIMDWIGGAKEAASEGHDVVMTSYGHCYLDHYQSKNHKTEPQATGGYLPLDQVYSFKPIPAGLPTQFQSHILGPQANLWTTCITTMACAEYMMFPRLCALSEVAWSAKTARNWDGFQQRLKLDERCLDELRVNYRQPGGVK